MSYQAKNGPAPSDEEAAKVWKQIMDLAAPCALIVQAYGGVATLAMPDEQRKAGIRNQTLRMELFELEDEAQTAPAVPRTRRGRSSETKGGVDLG